MPQGDPDTAAVLGVQAGQADALEALVRRHERWVRGIVYAAVGDAGLIDDVAQQVWTAVWRRIGSLKDPRRWRGWLYRLARNTAIDAARKHRRDHQLLRDAAEAHRRADRDATDADAERREQVLQAVMGLPGIYREPLILKHLEGWSYRQIAETLDMPVDTVETRLVRARRLLRAQLQDQA